MTGPDPLPVASASRTFRVTVSAVTARPAVAVATLVVLATGVAASAAPPWLIGRLIDDVDRGGGSIAVLLIALVAALLVGAVVTWIGRVLLAGIVQRAIGELREGAFEAALAQPTGRLEAAGTGDLVSRLSGDVRAVGDVVSSALPAFVTALLTTVVTTAGLGLIDGRLALAALVASPLQLWALRSFLRRSGPVYRAHRAAQGVRAQRLIETTRGADTVRALRAERLRLDDLDAVSRAVIGLELRAARVRAAFYGRLNAGELVGVSAVLVTGFLLVAHDGLSVGAATAAALYFLGLFDPIGTLLGTVDELQDAGASLARLVGVLDLPTPADAVGSRERAEGRLELRGVSHRYRPGRPDLDDITLTIEPRERVAIVGASGAGKSTLAKVVAGLLAPDSGTVLLDDRPIDGRHPDELRASIAMISQELHVFSGTIRDDLRLFDPEATDARLSAVLGDKWIRSLPDGLDTVVGAGGAELSPARTQYLALARLALADTPVVILDEATAEAGSEDGDLLDRAVERIVRGRTGIVVAHRLAQAERADRVLVMADGRIVQDGTHVQLLAVDGPYAELWRSAGGVSRRPEGLRTGSAQAPSG
ncbi:ATP-binding cassette domain-containing protein [Rathayibacter sp. VKM Ac-2803]|uniref:ABC transporter ATP-binding protein n=1 Tax=Rathayibacter sp. VKM Ac-2803 TaxID=2609256 RepID=UPI0013573405|nr:ABC transporter ATP-binding protein [Rathayibacter sp. VKM Ac-2803]MWV50712.1 ATP-binding cassette domain-containing protein [Rathayibacter sp. VKM Ac-2803]